MATDEIPDGRSQGTKGSVLAITCLRAAVRFLPFEGAGAISTWTLVLPAIRSYDCVTISDVILHMRCTARDGAQALRG